jgi:hypothetical protein
MLDNWIIAIDQGRDLIISPDQSAFVPLLCWMKEEFHAGIIALSLNAVYPSSFAPKPNLFRFPKTHTVDGLEGACGERLCHRRIDVIRQPTRPDGFGVVVQVVFRKAVLPAQVRERLAALLLL